MLAQCNEPRARLTVLHLSQPVEGGVAKVVADLAASQVREGMRVVVACPGGRLARAAEAAGAQVVHWPARRDLGPHVAAEAWHADRLIRRVRPGLVHAHSAKAGLVARLVLRGRIPTVHQPHAWSFEAVTGRTARLARAWERRAAAWTDLVLCVSAAERRAGEAAGVSAPWAVVPNGVDVAAFAGAHARGPADPADAERRRACRAALPALRDVPADAPLVVCVGRLCEQKGQSTLLRAWPRVTACAPGARLALVGEGPDREALRRLAPHGTILAGPSDDVPRWYGAADLVVLPSRWEGMALTPLEAMACGRPVVVSDAGGSRECLPPGQEELCLVPPDDPGALADALTRLVTDPQLRAFLAESAGKHVRAEFDLRRTTAAVSGLYLEVLRARALAPAGPRAGTHAGASADTHAGTRAGTHAGTEWAARR